MIVERTSAGAYPTTVQVLKSCRIDRGAFWVAKVYRDGRAIGFLDVDGKEMPGYKDYVTKQVALGAADLSGLPLEIKDEAAEIDAGKKDTNPKEALGIKKVPTYCIPTGPLLELGLAFMEGGRKYGAHNYRDMGARHSVYLDAIERHRLAHLEGEDIDPDSGLYHLAKIMGCCAVLLDSIMMGNDIDDRPIQYPKGLNMVHYNHLAEEIIKKYPDCKEPFTEANKETRGK